MITLTPKQTRSWHAHLERPELRRHLFYGGARPGTISPSPGLTKLIFRDHGTAVKILSQKLSVLPWIGISAIITCAGTFSNITGRPLAVKKLRESIS